MGLGNIGDRIYIIKASKALVELMDLLELA